MLRLGRNCMLMMHCLPCQDVTEETAEVFLEDKVGRGLVHPSVASVKLPELPHMTFPDQVSPLRGPLRRQLQCASDLMWSYSMPTYVGVAVTCIMQCTECVSLRGHSCAIARCIPAHHHQTSMQAPCSRLQLTPVWHDTGTHHSQGALHAGEHH